MKTCSKCGVEHPIEKFALRSKADITIRRSVCKNCTNKYSQEYKKGYSLASDPVDWKPQDTTNMAMPNRMNLWDRPIYVSPKWGRQ